MEYASVEGVATTEASGKIGQQHKNRNRSARVRKQKRAVRQDLHNLSEPFSSTNGASNICKKLKINKKKKENHPEQQQTMETDDLRSTTNSTSNGHQTSNNNNNNKGNSNINTNNGNDIQNNTRRHNRVQERTRERRRRNLRGSRPSKVPINSGIHGNRLKPKEFGYTRVAVENFNSLGVGAKPGRNSEYVKVTKLRRVIRQLDLDILGGSEVRANWTVLGEAKSLSNTFRSETEFR